MTPTVCVASSARQTCCVISTASSGGSFCSLVDQGTQVLTLNKLHGDELHAVGFAQVVNANDILVRDLRRQEELLLESRQNRRIAGQFAAE